MPPGRKTPYTLKAKENGTGFALAPRKDERLKLEAGRDDYSKEAQKFSGKTKKPPYQEPAEVSAKGDGFVYDVKLIEIKGSA